MGHGTSTHTHKQESKGLRRPPSLPPTNQPNWIRRTYPCCQVLGVHVYKYHTTFDCTSVEWRTVTTKNSHVLCTDLTVVACTTLTGVSTPIISFRPSPVQQELLQLRVRRFPVSAPGPLVLRPVVVKHPDFLAPSLQQRSGNTFSPRIMGEWGQRVFRNA